MESSIKIIIAGTSVRHIACSAARVGHDVLALDSYCDHDLNICASQTVFLDATRAEKLIYKYAKQFSPDAIVLGPGLEGLKIKGIRTLNNSSEKVFQVSDKLWLARWLENRGYPAIQNLDADSQLHFPVIVKPRRGAGGLGCRLVEDEEDLIREDGLIIQEFVKGIPSSVSVISNGHESKAIAVNEQLIGLSWTGAKDFRYCGNITPLNCHNFGLEDLAERIISELGLIGSNGVDFILTKSGPLILEVNPRFQGSLDTVEISTGKNVFEAHVKAFQGCLPGSFETKCTAGRAIIFAENDLRIKKLLNLKWITDIPMCGSLVRIGDPLVSILAAGDSQLDVLRLLQHRSKCIKDVFLK